MNDAPRVNGLTDDEQDLFDRLHAQLVAKTDRNAIRARYYDARNALRTVGVGTPPAFRQLATVLGWPAKAVDQLANRCRLEEFVGAGVDVDSLGLSELWVGNRLGSESSQATTSKLIHAVSWLVVTKGGRGEPPALITGRDALSGTGLWDRRSRRLSAFLSVVDRDQDGNVIEFVMYRPAAIVQAVKETTWSVDRSDNPLGRVPVEPLVFRPRLGRPFGSSRISRPVMSMTDLAMRTVMRSEVTAELYSVPQRVILGADESMFKNSDGSWKSDWQMAWAKVLGIPADENGSTPDFKQLQQATQEPHMAQLRSLAQLFAGETSIPISSLGISTDSNPASAEAVHASREDLIELAEASNGDDTPAWQRTAITSLQIANDYYDSVPPDWWKVRPRWRNPAHVSLQASADALTKAAAVFPWFAESDTAIELYGFDPVTVARLLADKRRSGAQSLVTNLAAASGGRADSQDAAAVKARADALGVLIRSGVDPEVAAQRVGLDVTFTGAVPVSLRVPERAAAELEQ